MAKYANGINTCLRNNEELVPTSVYYGQDRRKKKLILIPFLPSWLLGLRHV